MILWDLNFVTLVNFSLQKVQKSIKNKNSELPNVLKRLILRFYDPQKLISQKNLSDKKIRIFPHCLF